MSSIISFLSHYALYIVIGVALISALPNSPLTELKNILIQYRPITQNIIIWVKFFYPIGIIGRLFLAYIGVSASIQLLLIALRATGIIGS